jgi:hypothetical protein
MDVLALLRSKNRSLEGFLAISRAFLDSLEAGSDLAGLDRFHAERDASLKTIDLYDRKISEAVNLMPTEVRTPELVEEVRAQLDRKESTIREILTLDLEIMARIENARNALIKDLSATRKSQETLGKFKSRWVPEAGEEIDQKL